MKERGAPPSPSPGRAEGAEREEGRGGRRDGGERREGEERGEGEGGKLTNKLHTLYRTFRFNGEV